MKSEEKIGDRPKEDEGRKRERDEENRAKNAETPRKGGFRGFESEMRKEIDREKETREKGEKLYLHV